MGPSDQPGTSRVAAWELEGEHTPCPARPCGTVRDFGMHPGTHGGMGSRAVKGAITPNRDGKGVVPSSVPRAS